MKTKEQELLSLLRDLIISGEIKISEDILIDYPEIHDWLASEEEL